MPAELAACPCAPAARAGANEPSTATANNTPTQPPRTATGRITNTRSHPGTHQSTRTTQSSAQANRNKSGCAKHTTAHRPAKCLPGLSPVISTAANSSIDRAADVVLAPNPHCSKRATIICSATRTHVPQHPTQRHLNPCAPAPYAAPPEPVCPILRAHSARRVGSSSATALLAHKRDLHASASPSHANLYTAMERGSPCQRP